MNNPAQSPPDSNKVPAKTVWAYAIGVAASAWANANFTLAMPIFNLELGLDVAILGMLLAGLRIFDAFTDPLCAQWSDNLRSQFGRRRPFIVVGGLFTGVVFAALWMFPHDWPKPWLFAWFAVMQILLSLGTTAFGTGYYALGMELANTYEGRTRIMVFRDYVNKVANLLNPWVYFIVQLAMFGGALNGIRWVGALIGGGIIATSVVSGLLTPERYATVNATTQKQKLNLAHAISETAKNKYFWIMIGMGLALQLSMALFDTLGLYINIYYVFDGDKAMGAKLGGYGNTIAFVIGMATVPLVWGLCNRIGKHVTARLALAWIFIGAVLKFWLYTPEHPYLQLLLPFFYSLGITSLGVVGASMMADVVDVDELHTGRRREAMFGALGSWINKMVLSGAIFLSGWLVKATGFDLEKGAGNDPSVFLTMRILYSFAAAFFILLALLALLKYDLTKQKCDEIKAELDLRRSQTP